MKNENLYVKKKDLGMSILLTLGTIIITTITTGLWSINTATKDILESTSPFAFYSYAAVTVIFTLLTLGTIIGSLIMWVKTLE